MIFGDFHEFRHEDNKTLISVGLHPVYKSWAINNHDLETLRRNAHGYVEFRGSGHVFRLLATLIPSGIDKGTYRLLHKGDVERPQPTISGPSLDIVREIHSNKDAISVGLKSRFPNGTTLAKFHNRNPHWAVVQMKGRTFIYRVDSD